LAPRDRFEPVGTLEADASADGVIAAGLNDRKIAAPRGGVWQVGQVANLMKRLQTVGLAPARA